MQPGVAGRPIGFYPQYIPPPHFTYHSTINPRVSFYHPPIPQPYIQTHPQPIQTVPFQSYLPQYHSMFIPNAPFAQHTQPYYPHCIPSPQVSPQASQT